MTGIHGECDDRFVAVREAFRANLVEGRDVGASVAVTLDGELVVDLWGGHADEARKRPWERDTIANVYSTTKTMTNLCALMLADRGQLDFHAPVAKYWPEFAQNGKAAVEVRHLMSHSSGLSGWDEPLTVEDLYDWEKVTSLLAAQAPWWEPGTASGYHSLTQGYLVGEVVRRDHRALARHLLPRGGRRAAGRGLPHRARRPPLRPRRRPHPTGADRRRAEHGRRLNPRAHVLEPADERARLAYGRLAARRDPGGRRPRQRAVGCEHPCGGRVRRQRWAARACSRRPAATSIFEEQIRGTDLALGSPVRFGMGFGLNSPEVPLGPNPRTCYWGGWGGSIVVIDCDAHLTVSYVMNKMNSTTTATSARCR